MSSTQLPLQPQHNPTFTVITHAEASSTRKQARSEESMDLNDRESSPPSLQTKKKLKLQAATETIKDQGVGGMKLKDHESLSTPSLHKEKRTKLQENVQIIEMLQPRRAAAALYPCTPNDCQYRGRAAYELSQYSAGSDHCKFDDLYAHEGSPHRVKTVKENELQKEEEEEELGADYLEELLKLSYGGATSALDHYLSN